MQDYLFEKDKVAPSESLSLQAGQVFPYTILCLLKKLGFLEGGLKAQVAKFYSEIKDWHHDSDLFTILMMVDRGPLIDFKAITGQEYTIEQNSINLICGVVSLLEVEHSEPWKINSLVPDQELTAFNTLGRAIKDSFRNYFESSIFTLTHVYKKFPLEHDKLFSRIKFKSGNGLLFATILKDLLQNKSGDNFLTSYSKWFEVCHQTEFVKVLISGLNLWDSVYEMIMKLTKTAKVVYLEDAFENANIVFKRRIEELGLKKLILAKP